MAQSGHIVSIYKSRNNLLDILKEQDYEVNEYEGSSIIEINSIYQNTQLDMLLTKKNDNKKIYVKYHLGKTLRPNNIYEYIDDLFTAEDILKKNDDLMIIMNDEPNDTLIKLLTNIWEQDKIFVTIINIKRLQFNILKHSLVPPHRVLSNEESDIIKEKYHIKNDKEIPDISRFGPVSQAIGIRPGQMCEIIRPSRTSINSTFYRICS